MAVPSLKVRIDFARDGSFATSGDDVSDHVLSDTVTWTRGRSADFSAEATGAASFTLRNDDGTFGTQAYADAVLATNPLAYWRLGEPSGTVAADATGNGHTGTYVTAPTLGCTGALAGDADTAVAFNGTTQYVDCGAALAIGDNFTLLGWVSPVATGGVKRVILSNGKGSGCLSIEAGGLLHLAKSGTSEIVSSTGVVPTGAWHQAAVTKNGASVHLYVDGLDVTGAVTNATCAEGAYKVGIGADNALSTSWYDFQNNGVDEPAIWDRALTPAEIAGLYAAGTTKAVRIGQPVQLFATYSAVDYPLFFGYIERVAPDAREKTVTITCYDMLRRLSEAAIVVPANAYITRTARDFRVEVLSDFERGTINLCHNGSVESAITGWAIAGGGTSVTRITTDAAPGLGSACVQFIAASANVRTEFALRLVPVFFAGQTYRASVWLKSVSGATAWTVGLYGGAWSGAGIADRSLTLTGTWTRTTFTVTLPATYTASAPLTFFILATGAGTVLADGLMVSRGTADPAYTSVVSGRWPNWVGNGSFDGGALSGWYDAWTNLCTNGSFETNTTGWAGSAPTRSTAQHFYGAASCGWSSAGTITFNLSGTFKAGQIYDLSAMILTTGGNPSGTLKVWSIGTPADVASVAWTGASASTWYAQSVSWTPSADRADAQIVLISIVGAMPFVDGVQIVRRDLALGAQVYPYADVGPGGGGSFVTARALSSTAPKYGLLSQYIATPGTAGAGRVYDFAHYGSYFLAGQAYTLSVWLNPSSSMPYKIGLSANKGDGTFDEATATGTAGAGAWTQATVTWTPTADRSSGAALSTMLYVYQTDATGRGFLIDGVRVIPGSSADNFEQPYWNLAQESDAYSTTASLSGSALSGLSQINGVALSRHWIEPTMAAPFYSYNVSSRDDYAVKTSAETFDDDLNDMTSAEIDRASIVNIVPITKATGVDYYVDQTNVETYGERPTGAIGGYAFGISDSVADAIGGALLARYKDPRARPQIKVVNRFPSQLQRELDDLVTVNFARLGISGGSYLILRLDSAIGSAGNEWTTTYQLEDTGRAAGATVPAATVPGAPTIGGAS
jgi:Concanavalin A-like lectin/glucanases superfamily